MLLLKFVFISLFALFCSKLIFATEKTSHTLIFATDEFPPYSSKYIEGGGVNVKLVVSALNLVGYKAEVRFYPWKRVVSSAKRGFVDGVIGIWFRDDRKEWLAYSNITLVPEKLVFMKKSARNIQFTSTGKFNLNDLKNYSVGIIDGYSYPKYFIDSTAFYKDKSNNEIISIAKLIKGRIDLVLINEDVAWYHIKERHYQELNNIEAIGPIFKHDNLYAGISHRATRSTDKLKILNKGLRLLEESGQKESIIAKHKKWLISL